LAVGHPDQLGRFGELAGVLDRFQQREQLRIDRLARLMTRFPDQVEIKAGVGHMQFLAY
jgi:hypothetical protein